MSFIGRFRKFLNLTKKENETVDRTAEPTNYILGTGDHMINHVTVSEYPIGSTRLGTKQKVYLKEIQSVYIKKPKDRIYYQKRYGFDWFKLKDIISNGYYTKDDKLFLNNLKKFHVDVVVPYKKLSDKLTAVEDNSGECYGIEG